MHPDFLTVWNSPKVASFVAAWQNVREGNALPARGDIRLQDFAVFADSLAIHERLGPDHMRYRLAGSMVPNASDTLNLFDLYAADVREGSELWYNHMFDTPCAGVADTSLAFPNGTHRVCFNVALPIIGPDGSTLMLALLILGDVIRASEPRDALRVGLDHCVGTFVDIGYGLPSGVESSIVTAKPRLGFYG